MKGLGMEPWSFWTCSMALGEIVLPVGLLLGLSVSYRDITV